MLKSHFTQTDVLYYNTGSFSLVPTVVLESQIQELRNFEKNPTLNLLNSWKRMWKTQVHVAQLLGADPQDLFLRHNVTGGLNDFLLGVKLRPGDLAVTDHEYGAITNICKLRCQLENRHLQIIKIPPEDKILSAEELVDTIVRQLTDSTRLLLISHVCTGNGLKIPLNLLAEKLKSKNIVLAVDGAQGAGSYDFKLNDLNNVHFYGGNFHKWFLGAKGSGFGWIPSWFQDQVNPIQGGWTSFEATGVFEAFAPDSRFAQKMLMSNCLNFSTFSSLSTLTDWWLEQTPQNIFSYLKKMRQSLEEKAQAHGWKTLSSSPPDLQSSLLSLYLPERHQKDVLELGRYLAQEKQVQVAFSPLRGQSVLRLSAHVYNDEAELDNLFKRLAFLLT